MMVFAEVAEKILWIVAPAVTTYIGVFGIRRAVDAQRRNGERGR